MALEDGKQRVSPCGEIVYGPQLDGLILRTNSKLLSRTRSRTIQYKQRTLYWYSIQNNKWKVGMVWSTNYNQGQSSERSL